MKDEIIETLILDGSLEVAGLDSDGSFLYSFTKDFENTNPGLFKYITENINNAIMNLWANDFIELGVDENNQPMISLTEKGVTPSNLEELSEFDFSVLEAIVSHFEKDK